MDLLATLLSSGIFSEHLNLFLENLCFKFRVVNDFFLDSLKMCYNLDFHNMLSYDVSAAAIQCLKRKRLYEQQIEQLGNFQLRIHDQVSLILHVQMVLILKRKLYLGFWRFGLIGIVSLKSQMIMLEGAKATTETVDALRTGAAAMKAMQKATYALVFFVREV